MQAILILVAAICFLPCSAWALILNTPSSVVVDTNMTITYTSEAADPPGNLTFWFGKLDGVGGRFLVNFNIPPSKTAAEYIYEVPFNAETGQQFEVSATVAVSNFPTDLFQVSSPILVVGPSSSSSGSQSSTSASISSTALSTGSASVGTQTSGPSVPAPKKSSPPVGLIVGITIAVLLVLVVLLLLFLWRRRARRRKTLANRTSIDPAITPFSAAPTMEQSEVSPYLYTRNTDSKISGTTAYFTESTVGSSSSTPPRALSSKAAAVRQEYLRNQMRAVQREMAELDTAPSPRSSQYNSASTNSNADSDGLEHARQQNAVLQARVQMLESQLDSQWARGLSDEPPPGYIE
ncbi:hypothetical protein C8J57DRAFT_197526 [Mycena rebaudengoi]|nr:hypothetical protein C8J57DRAFT_197526 [Mycena rebaudengoi]